MSRLRLRTVVDPSILKMRVSGLLTLYRWRVRRHGMQEALAAAGIAVGVALCFGVLVANTSIVGSAGQLIDGVIGSAHLELSARSSSGFPEALARRAEHLPGVKHAAAVLRADASIIGPQGRTPILLEGVTPAMLTLQSNTIRNLSSDVQLTGGGIGLPSAVAEDVGAQARRSVTLMIAGRQLDVNVAAVLGSQTIGPISGSPVAVAVLPYAQQLAGLQGRVSELLIEPQAGKQGSVERELRRLAGTRLTVAPASHELQLLAEASKPNDQSTTLFAAISAMVGFLLALNAMLLTVPERRRFVAELRTQGFGPRQVLLILGSQALILGLVGSLLGVALGDLLAHSLFRQVPRVLTYVFPVAPDQSVPPAAVAVAICAGVFAALAASAPPALDLRRGRGVDSVMRESGEAGNSLCDRVIGIAGAAGAAIVVLVSVAVLIVPAFTVIGGVVLALAVVCLVVPLFALAVRALLPLTQRLRGSMLALAVIELRATATRSVALAGVAALAVYGSVAVLGARADLIRGLDDAVSEYLAPADVWVSTGNDTLTVDKFAADGAQAMIAAAPGVAAVRPYQAALLDVGSRRLWVRARSPAAPRQLEASQIVEGELGSAEAKLRASGWASVSTGFAEERHLKVGDAFILPTPGGPARLRVAAITTNIGWTPGALTLSAADFARYWGQAAARAPTAFEVDLKPGLSAAAGREAVRRALRNRPGLVVQTLAQREAVYETSARQGLRTLGQISTLLLITAALAVAAALSAAIWMRRAWFASLKTKGFSSMQLLRTLLWESAIVLGVGCLVGAVLGVYGHALASRWLEMSTGFPAPFAFGEMQVLVVLALVAGIALAIVALPGARAARVSPQTAFQE
jgi:putative ABC transport system permease protein